MPNNSMVNYYGQLFYVFLLVIFFFMFGQGHDGHFLSGFGRLIRL